LAYTAITYTDILVISIFIINFVFTWKLLKFVFSIKVVKTILSYAEQRLFYHKEKNTKHNNTTIKLGINYCKRSCNLSM